MGNFCPQKNYATHTLNFSLYGVSPSYLFFFELNNCSDLFYSIVARSGMLCLCVSVCNLINMDHMMK